MILDAIIGLFVSIVSALSEGLAIAFVPLVNGIAAALEAVIGLFVTGFSLGRIKRNNGEPKSKASAVGSIAALLGIVALIAWLVVGPRVMKQTVTLVAQDGHSLPFAALIVHTSEGDRHLRTDNAGNLVISRFRTTAVTVKDPRYVEKTWPKSEIAARLVVERTVLGTSLDSLADQLLKRAKE